MANANIRKEKEAIVAEISDKLKNAKGTVIVEYRGLSVAEITELRNKLRDEKIEMQVYKNTLSSLASKDAGYADLDKYLTGPNAFVFGMEDEVAAARVLADFAKTHKALVLKAGTLDGKVIDTAMVQEIASIPGREGLLTQLAAGLLQPLKEVAIGLNMLEESHLGK